MSHSLSKLYTHIIFHVKNDHTFICMDDTVKLYAIIGNILKNNNCIPIRMNGTSDHIHIFCVAPRDIPLADIMRNVKSLSSQWLKTVDIYYNKFAWQGGYGAFSVSPSVCNKTIEYIDNQQEHHQKQSREEEFRRFLDEYNIEYDPKYI